VAEEEFYNFEEALDELSLKEEELKRLVSEGEIRAFRDGDTMRLRKADVENLKNELMGGEVVDLGSAGEELVFEDDVDLGEAGMATEEISEMDTLLDDVDEVEDVGELELADEEEDQELTAAPVRRSATALAPQAAEEEQQESMGMRAVAIVTTFVLVIAIPVAISVSSGNASALAQKIAGIFGADFSN
jgi:excisionase family DNA binding protein